MKTFNLPNAVTLLRILFVPFFVALLIYQNYRYALYIFVIAGLSDALDGFIARKTHSQSELGMLLDPLADKLLLAASFIVFAYIHLIPVWFTVIILSRDLFIIIGWFLMFLVFTVKTVHPSIIGKTANALQIFLVAYILLDRTIPASLKGVGIILWVTAFFAIVSGVHYIYKGLSYANGKSGHQ